MLIVLSHAKNEIIQTSRIITKRRRALNKRKKKIRFSLIQFKCAFAIVKDFHFSDYKKHKVNLIEKKNEAQAISTTD